MSGVTTGVTVVVTVHVTLGSSWGEDCSLGQVYAQAAEQARTVVLNAIAKESRITVGPVTATQVRVLKEGER